MKKSKLPQNWVVVNSKSHPDRVYYFNVKTNESSWNEPTAPEANKTSGDDAEKPKKRKKTDEEDSVKDRATTPDLEEINAKITTRRTLLAKRQLEPTTTERQIERDTPAMAEIRKKIQQRKTKNGLPMNNLSMTVSSTSNNIGKMTASIKQPNKSTTDAKLGVMTPQMKVVYEKMQQKNMKKKGPKQSEPSSDIKDTTETNTGRLPKKRNRNRNRKRKLSGNNNNIIDDNTKNPPTESFLDSTKNTLQKKNEFLHRFKQSPVNKECTNNVIKKGGSAILKKNIANERLEKLKKNLSTQMKDQKTTNKLSQNCDESLIDIMNSDEQLDLYKTVNMRHRNLRNRLLRSKDILHTDEMISSAKSNAQDRSSNTLQEDPGQRSNNTSFCEEMDWEPMEDEKITFEVQAARTQLCVENIIQESLPVVENILRIPSSTIQEEKKTLYIVIDTNVFLSELKAVEKARDIQFGTYNRPILVVPWTVIRELDFLKDDKSRARSQHLRAKARKAINFLNDHFSAKHPRIVGQTPEDVVNNKEKFAAECPDDEILQACLQIRDAGRAVALLSYDKNLCNKAMIHDIVALGRDDPLEKIDYLSSNSNANFSFHDIYFQDAQKPESEILSTLQEELHISDELYEDVQSTIKECLSVIVSKEMKNLYGDTWEKYAIIKPPWTISCVLKCAVKHWIAAISEAFDRHAEPILKELQEIFFKMPKTGRKLKDIAYLLEKCSDLTNMIKVDKYPDLMSRASSAIDEIRKRCENYMNEIREKKLRDEIGAEDDITQQKHRADKAFKYFDDIYTYARDIGGMAADIEGLPCSFCYQVPNPSPPVEYVKKVQPEVAQNVHRLLNVLNTALEQMQSTSLEHRALLDLYHTITNFLPERLTMITSELSPLDIYCCLKQKENVLKTGLQQLQELSTHFCRLASYRCT